MIKTVKVILVFLSILFFIGFNNKEVNSSENENIVKIREGAFVKVMARDEISSLISDIGDEVSFIAPQDVYVYETNAIPENTIFYGEIEDVKEPVEGRDGALKILIYKMITPDRKVYRLNAHIYTENDNYIGGNTTASIYYHKVPHYIKGFRPILQEAPLNIYEMGQHTIIEPGSEFLVIFDKDVILK